MLYILISAVKNQVLKIPSPAGVLGYLNSMRKGWASHAGPAMKFMDAHQELKRKVATFSLRH